MDKLPFSLGDFPLVSAQQMSSLVFNLTFSFRGLNRLEMDTFSDKK